MSLQPFAHGALAYTVGGDKLFRRVRDEHVNLTLSQAAKSFHPGQGVYRSSYMNARRLAATENNIAYRTADYERYQQLDFVVGIEVHLSNNHNCKGVPDGEFVDICDQLAGRYPKDFKFVGWHPNCMCHQIPILATQDEVNKMAEAILNDESPETVAVEGRIEELPENFLKWLKDNENRIVEAESRGTLPYFISDNKQMIVNVVSDFENTIIEDAIAKDVVGKLSKASESVERSLFVSFETISPAIVSAVQKVKRTKRKNEIYESIITDSRANVLNDYKGHRTVEFPGHKGSIHPTWNATKQMAFTLNENGIDVAFLPEKTDSKIKYADSVIKMSKKRYLLADFKYCTTDKYNTLGEDLIDGFIQAKTIVLKVPNMDAGRLFAAIEQVKRKTDKFGNIIIINEKGKIIELTRKDIKFGKHKLKFKGFL